MWKHLLLVLRGADEIEVHNRNLSNALYAFYFGNEPFEQVITGDVLNLESGGLASSHYEGVWGLC